MLLADLAETSRAVAATRSRLRKVELLAAALRRMGPREVAVGVSYLAGDLRQGRIGIGVAAVREAMVTATPAERATLELTDVDAELDRVAGARGAGSAADRRRALASLLSRGTRAEQELLARLVLGELRQGALEGVMVEAVARASGAPVAEVRRAAMVAGDLRQVAEAALAEGVAGLRRFPLRLMSPLQPMLAQPAGDVGDALASLGEAALEHKLDGARVQVHKDGSEVRVFSRALRDVTPAVPEIVEAVQALPARSVILDGEALAFRPDRTPEPFQVTMRRFARKLDAAALRRELPLSALFFAFLEDALRRGHEGVMAKSLAAPYEAG
ncbi:MAG TPA: ATP-dependent DNA ligase, partial [Anaeromyxobacteraceae bacterium]